MTESIQPINQGTNIKRATRQAKHILTITNNPYAQPFVRKCFKCEESIIISTSVMSIKLLTLQIIKITLKKKEITKMM